MTTPPTSISKKPKSLKIQEFYAHSDTVNSVSLGQHSSQVLVTGSDDGRVNVWKLGKTQPIMSLVGHQTEVDCVMFDEREEHVAAGSRGGSVKLWDLSHEKLVRTLSGHRASIRSLDFHPFGDLFATGSLDTNLKIWDIRKKGCIQTFKGHPSSVTSVRHSPDGRWIVSGDSHGIVKVWDLTAGKLVQEFKSQPKQIITGLAFHPHEFLLAAASDHKVNFWDMETFGLVSSTHKEAQALRCIRYSRDGQSLLSGSTDALRVWGWEPVRCWDAVEMGWNGLTDMVISPADELIGVAKNKTVVAIYMVDLTQLRPFNQVGLTEEQIRAMDAMTQDMAAMDATLGSPPPQSISVSARTNASTSNTASTTSSQPTSARGSHSSASYGSLPNAISSPAHSHPSSHTSSDSATSSSPTPVPTSSAAPAPVSSSKPRKTSTSSGYPQVEIYAPSRKDDVNQTILPPARYPAAPSTSSSTSTSTSSHIDPPGIIPFSFIPSTNLGSTSLNNATIIPTSGNRDQPLGLNVNAFLPATPSAPSADDVEVIRKKIMQEHNLMCTILSQRLTNLKILRNLWSQGNVKAAIEALVKMNDLPVAVDFLNVAEESLKSGVLSLDMCRDMLPILKNLLTSRFEGYVTTSLKYIILLLQSFSSVIADTRVVGTDENINLHREERLQRCNDCYQHFKTIYPLLAPITKKHQGVGLVAREARVLLEKLIQV